MFGKFMITYIDLAHLGLGLKDLEAGRIFV